MYSKILINGNADINYLWSKKTFSDEEKSTGIKTPVFDYETVMLATFNNNLSASDIEPDDNIPIIGYTVYRQKVGEDIRKIAAKVKAETLSINDFNIESKQSYEYYISPIYYNKITQLETIGSPIKTDIISTDFHNWTIANLLPTDDSNIYTVDKGNLWRLSIDVTCDNFKINVNKNTLNTCGKFPFVSTENMNYISGTVTALLGEIDCSSHEYVYDTVEKIKKWRAFSNDGQLKLLKDCKGQVFLCDITDTSYSYENSIAEMPTTITFTFVELKDSENCSIYNTEG